MKYYKAEDVLAIFSEEERPLNWTDSEAEIQAENDFDCYKGMIEGLPTIEVSEGNQVLYGTNHNCILTMFGECSYNETVCGDCAVAEKIRKALSVEVSEDCISKAYLEQEIEKQIKTTEGKEYYWQVWNNALDKVVELIEDATSVVPTVRKNRTTEQSL